MAIAEWAKDRDVDRIGWPASLRKAVPALLGADVVPVLFENHVPAQQAAVSRTGVVVTPESSRPPTGVVESARFGDLTAHRIDLAVAGAEPLAVGEVLREEISRPYRYAPLRRSAVLPIGKALRRRLSLDPGRYRVEVEAYVGGDAHFRSSVIMALAPQGGSIVAGGGTAEAVVYEPIVAELEVPKGSSRVVSLGIGPVGNDDAPDLLVHGWSLTKVSAP